MDENGAVKGVALVIINTGGAETFQEMICDVTFASNRMRQLKMGKIQRHKEACPKGKQEASRTLATRIQIGRLLVKQEQKMSQERIILTQNAAFTTARTLTANFEQKLILKDWKEKEGADRYKQKRSGEILQSAAKMVGLAQEDIHGIVKKVETGMQKKPAGASSDGRLARKPEGKPTEEENATVYKPYKTDITPRKNTTSPQLW